MSDLVEFLRARLDDDERAAKAWLPFGNPDAAARAHVARHAPERVLRYVERDRLIVDLHDQGGERWEGFPRADKLVPYCIHDNLAAPCPTLRLLALPYADHEEFDDAWRI